MITNYTNRPHNWEIAFFHHTYTVCHHHFHDQASVLQACSRSPSQVSSEKNAARTLQQQEDDLQKLRDRVSVLAHAKDTDGRRFRQIAVERQREREDLKREVERLKVRHPSSSSLRQPTIAVMLCWCYDL